MNEPYSKCERCGADCSAKQYEDDPLLELFPEINRGPCYGPVTMIDEIEISYGEWEEVHCCANPVHKEWLNG